VSDPIKTLNQTLADLPDNTSRMISPADGRQIATLAIGLLLTRDPDADDDVGDSNGDGAADTGSNAFNTVTGSVWKCVSGTLHAAVWVKIGSSGNDFLRVKWTDHPALATPLTLFLASCTTLTGSSKVQLNDVGASAKVEVGYLWISGSGSIPSGRIVSIDNTLNQITVEAEFSSTATLLTSTIVPWAWAWAETIVDPDTGASVIDPGGASGTALTAPCLNLRWPLVDEIPQDFFMRFRGMAGGVPVYEMDELPDPTGSLDIGSASQVNGVTVNYFGSPGAPTTINYGDNVTVNVLNLSVVISGTPTPLIVGPTVNPALLPPSNMNCGTVVGVTTNTKTPVFSSAGAHGIDGMVIIRNLGGLSGFPVQFWIDGIDSDGNPITFNSTVSVATSGTGWQMAFMPGISGGVGNGRYAVSFTVSVNASTAGAFVNFRVQWILTEC
jgi:hypothetical protein